MNYMCCLQAADDAAEAEWFDVTSVPSLAFDHQEVVADCLRRASQLPNAQRGSLAAKLQEAGDKLFRK